MEFYKCWFLLKFCHMTSLRNVLFLLIALPWACNTPNSEEIDNERAYQIASAELDSNRVGLEELKWRLHKLKDRHAGNAFVWGHQEGDSISESLGYPDVIDDNVAQLEQLLADYRYRIAALENELEQSNDQTRDRQKVAERWYQNWIEAERDIALLITHLDKLEDLICQKEVQIDLLNDELNRVYFAFGTVDELARNGVVDTRKTIWGKKKVSDLSDDLNTDYFAVADKRNLKEIPILSGKAELLSNHPKDSFRFRGENRVDAIEIIDPERFWKQTDYLAIQVE